MKGGAAESLWYLAPGLVHQLGNALFTLHGRAQLLAVRGDGEDGDRRAILQGSERAMNGLRVLRWLVLDEGPVQAAVVLECLREVVRVPLRDQGLAFEFAGPAAATVAVEPGPFLRLCAAACRLVAGAAVPGAAGRLVLWWHVGPGGEVVLRLALEPAPGALPFPLDPTAIAAQLEADLRAAGATAGAAPAGRALAITCPPARMPGARDP